ncbi:MAG TPA: AraC family transcriptional regulator ligand-binding domain-containing protein [Cyclobacteriaceae bacterium]
MKILAAHLKGFIDYALLKGMSSASMLAVLQLKSFPSHDAKVNVLEKEFYALIELIAQHLDDELLGLRVGQQLNLNTLGVVYKISLRTKTMKEALHYCHSFLQKTFPPINITRTMNSGDIAFTLTLKSKKPLVSRIILETVLCVMAREIEAIAGSTTAVTLYSPFKTKDYPPHWKKSEAFKVVFRVHQNIPKRTDYWGLDMLIPEYLSLIESMKTENSFPCCIKISALKMAQPKLPNLEMIAYNLNIKTRTLQRKLMNEGTSYRKLSEELKQDISELLLRHEQFSIADISSILGYAEPAAFIHSFCKWHGKSPSQARGSMI